MTLLAKKRLSGFLAYVAGRATGCVAGNSNWLIAKFDPDKLGRPWMPGSASWVIPTGFALIALKQRRACSDSSQLQSRVSVGVQMLLDRACPNGGWNSGNGVVYGEPLPAHAEPTAVALLALQDEHRSSCIRNSLNWLRDSAPSLVSVSSLA